MAKVGSIIAALRLQVVGVLRFQVLVLLRLSNRVLPGVGVQHAPVGRESFLELDLQSVGNGPSAIVERADFADIRHRTVIESAIIRRSTGYTRRVVGSGAGFKIGVQWLGWLIAIAEKRKFDATRSYIRDLQYHALGERPLYV